MRKFGIVKNVNSAQVSIPAKCQECAGFDSRKMSGVRRFRGAETESVPTKRGIKMSKTKVCIQMFWVSLYPKFI